MAEVIKDLSNALTAAIERVQSLPRTKEAEDVHDNMMLLGACAAACLTLAGAYELDKLQKSIENCPESEISGSEEEARLCPVGLEISYAGARGDIVRR